MNRVLHHSFSAIFTTLAIGYFFSSGLVRVVQRPRRPSVPALGMDLARGMDVKDELFRPLPRSPGISEENLQAVKAEQDALKARVDVQVGTILRVEDHWKGGLMKMEALEKQWVEAQKLLQETKTALGEAQARIERLEGALKVSQDKELKASQNAKKTVKMFSTMPPEKVAKILQEWTNADAADLLGRMKESEAAAILTLLPPKRAALLSGRLSGNKGGPP